MSSIVSITLNVVLLIICIIHASVLLNNSLNPKLPSLKVYNKKIGNIPFPFVFKICAYKLNNTDEKFKNFGYKNNVEFYMGKSMHHCNYFGWNGFSTN